MGDDNRVALVAVVLGFIAIVMLVMATLALADVARGEPDLAFEWNVIRAALVVVLVAQVLALAALARSLRGGRDRGGAQG
jgi:hypothetical protein